MGQCPDWTNPADQTQALVNGETITFSGVYEPENPFSAAFIGTDSTLEVMTWNLQHFPKESSVTADWVIKVIEGLDVDIIALQEIESALHFEEMVDSLEGWSGYRADSASLNMDLAYIYRTDGALQVESIQEIMSDQSRPFPRRPLLMLGSFNDKPIAVINNHFKCCGDGIMDETDIWDVETRSRDASVLLEEYVQDNISDRRVCILGDFNDELTDAAGDNVFANFLGNPGQWLATDFPIAEGSSSGWSFPNLPSHLDHIFINQLLFEAAGGDNASVQVVPLMSYLPGGWNEYYHDVSDHLPVVLVWVP